MRHFVECVRNGTPAREDYHDGYLVNCVLDGKKPLVPVEESLKVQAVLDAIYESAANGKEVRIG